MGISRIVNEIVHTFSEEFCDEIIGLLDNKDKVIIHYEKSEIHNELDLPIQKNQPTDADGWDFNRNKDIIDKIINVITNYIGDIDEHPFVVQRLDKTKKSKPHYDYMDYTAVLLLNNNFKGGELIIEDVEASLKKGNLILFRSNRIHYVSKVTEGERYTLVGFIGLKKKIKKTFL
jgi:hypothetical protein